MAQFKSNFGFLQPFACVFMILVCGDFTQLGNGYLRKRNSEYVKCIKIFFGYHKSCNISHILMYLGLSSFYTVTFNANLICVLD